MRSLGGCAATSDGLILTAATTSGRTCVGLQFPQTGRSAKSPPASLLRADNSLARAELVLVAERGPLRLGDRLLDAAFGTTPEHL